MVMKKKKKKKSFSESVLGLILTRIVIDWYCVA